MKLSILILTHNRPTLFERCLKSVIQQLTSDVEVIVNNDSNDITEIQHPQVTYHYQSHKCLSDTYKFLLECATGDYVFYLEDDDYLTPTFIQSLKYDADMLVGNYYPRYDTPHALLFATLYKNAYVEPYEFISHLNKEHLQLSQHVYKRSTIVDFDFPNDSNIHNDILLTLHAADRCEFIRTMHSVFFYQTIDGGDNISFPKVTCNEVQ